MNKDRRKQLQEALEKLEEARYIIESVCAEEQEAFDNMPESLQASDRGQRMEESISQLESADSDIEGILEVLNEICE